MVAALAFAISWAYVFKNDLLGSLFLAIVTEMLTLETDLIYFIDDVKSSILKAISHMSRTLGGEVVEVLTGEKDILRKAEEMIENLKKAEDGEALAIWCIMRYNIALEKYFTKFKGEKVHRLINVDAVGLDNVRDHLIAFLNEIKIGNYRVYSTSYSACEWLIVNKEEVLELIPHVTTRKMYRGIYATDEHIVNARVKDFEDLKKQGRALNIPPTFSDDEAKKLIEQWIMRARIKS